MKRRDFLIGAVSCGAVVLPSAAAAQPQARQRAIAGWRKRIEDILDRGRLPIIDTHVGGKGRLSSSGRYRRTWIKNRTS
jgi:hypothetical protein